MRTRHNHFSPISIESLISDVDLPSLPNTLIKIYDILENDISDADSITRLLESDAALTARTMKLANSAYYGGPSQHTDLKYAVIRIGPMMLWSLLVSTTVRVHFTGIDTRLLDMFGYWRHSLYTACLSKSIAAQTNAKDKEILYLSGLLHDIGKLVFLAAVPLEYQEILNKSAHGDSLVDMENMKFGFSHATLGAQLLTTWGLPSVISDCVKYHHDTEYGEYSSAWIVATANNLCRAVLDDSPLDDEKVAGFDKLLAIETANAEYEKAADILNLT
ncbi:MAG: HDOD domain-containing protein [Gammaproteobacteria bacterium]|nr:HDOD domain-containing protein [Gammaproteobacteria bacterium]